MIKLVKNEGAVSVSDSDVRIETHQDKERAT